MAVTPGGTGPLLVAADTLEPRPGLETRPGRAVKVCVDGHSAVILTRESGLTPESAWADLVDWLRRKGHIG